MAIKTIATFGELKAAAEDGETSEIYLSADVTFSGGIRIPVAKKTLVIDGNGHTITDNNSSSYTDTIYIPSGAENSVVTVRNVVWSGRNYYGVICVQDSAQNAGVTTVLDGVTYKGPQMIYNRYGTTIVKDCAVSIEKNGSGVAAQEFCEGNRLIFEGKVTLDVASTSGAVVWFPFAGSAFTVAENAVVTINAPNTYMFYTDGAAKPAFAFGSGSVTRISVKNGLFYSSGSGAHIASSCTIGENATLYVSSSANNGVPLFKCSGNLTVNRGASLFLIMPTKGTSPLAYFSSAATLTFDSPKNVLLYSNGGKVFSFASGSASAPNVISTAAKQIAVWTSAKTPFESAGGFDDPPSSVFYKADGTNAEIKQTLSSSAVLATTSNLAEGDKGYPASGATLDPTKIAVFAAGRLDLSADGISDISTVVSGTTDPEASVSYSSPSVTASGKAAQNGSFSLALSGKPTAGDEAVIKSNRYFLTATAELTVSGSVSVSYLPDIPFNAFVSPKRSAEVNRLDPAWHLELTDTRPSGGKWSLYLTLKTPLSSASATIENAVTFSDGETITLGSSPVLVASGVSEKAGVIRVEWAPDEGVLLALAAEENYEKGDYSSTLVWSVEYE